MIALAPDFLCGSYPPLISRSATARSTDAWDAAIVRKDGHAIEANMPDDFRQRQRREVETRQSFVVGSLRHVSGTPFPNR